MRTVEKFTGPAAPLLCVHEFVEAQASRTPEAPAAAFGEQFLSYKELNRLANQFAHHLRGLGVTPEAPVGLFMERSLELAVAVLGLFKAGGALLPLDPDHPPDRLAFLMQDARPRVVVTRRRLVDRLSGADPETVCIDLDGDIFGGTSAANPAVGVVGEHLCALFYTSGSTGVPKAVATPHRVISSRLLWCQAHSCTLTPSDRFLLTSSLGQASFLGEFFAPLMAGATVVFARPGGHQDVAYLADMIAAEGITAVLLVPSMLRLLLREWEDRPPARCHGLRHISSHGEALPGELQERLRTCLSARVHKYYGLTEAPVATYWDCRDGEDLERVTIGRPTDMRLHLLDDGLQPVAPGAVGEIYLAGPGLARGYLNRPGLTAERFLPNPFAETPGERCFRTGDLARRLPNGVLEFLGRVDHQVNLHGLRIELGEVEAALADHPAVEEAAVVLRRGRADGEHLAGFVVPRPGQAVTDAELRSFARTKLPPHMVPPCLVVLDALPRNAHGKLDRTRLREWKPEPAALTDEPARAASPVERTLAGIWADVLGLARVDRRDHFLELGGDSIRAVQIAARAGKAGLRITPAQVFEHATVAELAVVAHESIREHDARPATNFPPLNSLVYGEDKAPPSAPRPPGGGAGSGRFPLSPAQQGMLFHTLYSPEAPVYLHQATYAFRGSESQAAAFRRAWIEVVNRHDALRTSFRWREGEEAFQVVSEHAGLRWDEQDWRGRPAPERLARLEAFLAADRRRRFDLAKAPLLRLALIRMDEEEYQVVCSHHHLVLDGWSAGLVGREVLESYAAQVRGDKPSLPPSPPYRDYVAWLGCQDLVGAEKFWRRTLSGFTCPTPLPGGPALVAPIRENDLAHIRRALPSTATAALRALCREHRLTLNTVIQCAWAMVLSRYSGTADIVFGAVVSGRPPDLPGADAMVGPFINTLPVRLKLEAGAALLPCLRDLQAQQVELRKYEYSPLVQVQGWSRVPRGLPLFESILAFQNLPAGAPAEGEGGAGGQDVRTFELTNYPLDLAVTPGDRLRLELQYDRRRFDPAVTDGMLAYFQELLEAMAADPERRLGELPPLAASERRLIAAWNDTRTDPYGGETLASLLEGPARRAGDATAVICGERRLTYRELHARADQLAHCLRGRGVGPEVRVGLCADRSLELAIGLLAVLKAGGACVLLDPTFPSARLALMLRDARVGLTLTQRRRSAALPGDCAVLELDAAAAPTPERSTTPAEAARPDNLACVVYTSGSTGRPRGVMLTHAGLVNLTRAAKADYGLEAGDRVLQFYSPSADVVAEEIFPTWLAGGTLILRPPDLELGGKAFVSWVRRQGITVLNLPAAFWKDWVCELETRPEPLPEALRLVVVGGEAACPQTLARWRRLAGGRVRWLNAYGPSEATVTATLYEPPAETGGNPLTPVPIGRPRCNVRAYVLDASLRPAPVGAPGELYLGGAGLARGYLDQPGRTAERFLPNPFAETPGERLYKTGDKARWLPGGNLEFLGRLDRQVKVRGFRVEPEEIEDVLRRHPAVREAVVVAREDRPGENSLGAYVASHGGEAPSRMELRDFLKHKLPEYMLPGAFVFLKELPLTPTGKLDRQGLPAFEAGGPDLAASYAAPRTALEEALASLWAEVLAVKRVGVGDSFFDLGGHSLLVVRLFARMEEKWGVRLPLAALYQGPTVGQLARVLAEALAPDGGRAGRSREKGDARPPLFCLNYGPTLSQRLGSGQPVFDLPVHGEARRGHARIESLAAALVKRLRGVQPEGPYYLSGFCDEGIVAIEMARQLAECGQAVAFLGLIGCFPFRDLLYASCRPGERRSLLSGLKHSLLSGLKRSQASPLRWLSSLAWWVRILLIVVGSRLSSKIRPDPRWGLWLDQSIHSYRPVRFPDHVAFFHSADLTPEYQEALRARLATYGIKHIDFHRSPGGHFTMLEEPHAAVLADQFRGSMEKAQSRTASTGPGSRRPCQADTAG